MGSPLPKNEIRGGTSEMKFHKNFIFGHPGPHNFIKFLRSKWNSGGSSGSGNEIVGGPVLYFFLNEIVGGPSGPPPRRGADGGTYCLYTKSHHLGEIPRNFLTNIGFKHSFMSGVVTF